MITPTEIRLITIPLFLISIGLELLWCKKKGLSHFYNFHDGFSSLAAGLWSMILPIFLPELLTLASYSYIHKNYPIFQFPADSVIGWILMFFFVDFSYWAFHWASHRSEVLWSAHIVHHNSEYYNLSTALRQGALQGYLVGIFFYLPFSLFFPVEMYTFHKVFNSTYQFFIHTELVGKLHPWIEYIFNTPSHHRIHHGRFPAYCIDKNYAGILIIWDRIFKTFEPERDDEPIVYGVTTPINTWDPVKVQFLEVYHLIQKTIKSKTPVKMAKSFFLGPGYNPQNNGLYPIPEVEYGTYKRWDAKCPKAVDTYLFIQFCLIVIVSMGYLVFRADLIDWISFCIFLWILWSTWSIAFMLNINIHQNSSSDKNTPKSLSSHQMAPVIAEFVRSIFTLGFLFFNDVSGFFYYIIPSYTLITLLNLGYVVREIAMSPYSKVDDENSTTEFDNDSNSQEME